MSLRAALVDRGRIVERAATGEKVDGRPVRRELAGEWFRCRLQVTQTPAQVDPSTGRRVLVKSPSLLCGTKDVKGGALVFTPELRVEVDSKQLGRATYDVSGEPEPLRKRRTLIGWQVQLRRSRVGDTAEEAA